MVLIRGVTFKVVDHIQDKSILRGTAKGDVDDLSLIKKHIHPAVHSIIAQYAVTYLADSNKCK